MDIQFNKELEMTSDALTPTIILITGIIYHQYFGITLLCAPMKHRPFNDTTCPIISSGFVNLINKMSLYRHHYFSKIH